ncbi:MAG: DUF1565 domain-containing protein [Clostridia bacterium]|nr:DUF1565 domain-containing protein [Clostridia bacterium]
MSKMFYRIISFVLILALCCVVPAVSASAEQTPEDTGLLTKPMGEIKYVASKGEVSGVAPKTNVATVIDGFDQSSGEVFIRDNSGVRVDSGVVGTGYTVNYKSALQTQSAQVVIYGDATGDGDITATDMLQVKRGILGVAQLSDAQNSAADISGDGDVTAPDLLALKRSLLGVQTIRNSAHYFVAANGNDNGDGSEANPYKTIEKAAQVMQAGDTCFVKSGIYRETVTPQNEGEKGAPITFTAYEGADVTVSGTDVMDSNWTLYQNGIYKTNITLYRDSENQIFANGQMAQIARYPNKNSDNLVAVGNVLSASGASDSYANSTSIGSAGLDFTNAEIAIEGTSHYLYYSSKVTAQNGNSVNYQKLNSGWDSPTTDSKFYFFNKLNLLDDTNEYYYENGTLYYKPAAGVDPNNMTMEYSARSLAFNTADRSYITISGLTITGATVRTNEGSDHLTLDNNKILYYYHTTKARSYPWECWFFGVELHGSDSVVKNCEIAYGAEGGVEIYADRCSVVNNYIHDINYINSNAAAVEPYDCDETLISHNTIRNVARTAIVLRCANMRVCYNDISECAVNTHDVSGIGSYATDALGTVEVDHNVVRDTKNDHAFVAYYLDNGSLNYTVHHNLAYNVDQAMILNNPSYSNRVYNNTLMCDKPIGTGNLDNPYDNNSFIGAMWQGNQFYNNILPGVFYGEGVMCSNNLLNADSRLKLNADYTLNSGSAAIDKGLKLPIGCEQYSGSAPDIGAFEYGEEAWKAGCDFTKEFDTTYSLTDRKSGFKPVYGKMFLEPTAGANKLTNPSFENGVTGWGAINATVTTSHATAGSNSVCITEGWIEQSISATPGQVYRISGKVKGYNIQRGFIEFGVHFMNGDNIISQGAYMVTNERYTDLTTLVSVPEGCNKIRFFVATWASGQTCYADDLQLVLMQ